MNSLVRNSPSGPKNNLPSFPAETRNDNVGAVATIDWRKGGAQSLYLSASATVTMVGLPAGQTTWFQLKVVQANGGSKIPTFAGAKTPGGTSLVFSTADGSEDIVAGYWDGSKAYLTTAGLAFL
jgi:hypothetical protein